MNNVRTEMFAGTGGTRLALHRMGQGRPLVLLHGLFSSAQVNWVKFGTAQQLVEAGFECLMPDLRVHGHSEAPHDPAAYPADVLVQDVQALVGELGLVDFDLAGFSLGARTAARAVLAGMKPRRLILAGMGLEGLAGWTRRKDFFVDVIDRFDTIKHGDPAFAARSFLKTMGVDRVAARMLLATMEDTEPGQLGAITMPTLVLCGAEDDDNGSASRLAQALPDARLAIIPGTHMSSVTRPELGAEMVRFLSDDT